MRTLLIIDLNNTLIRSLAVNKELEYDGVFTGGVYGLWTQLVASIHWYKPTHILICDDTKPYLREQLFPNFKGDRKHKPHKTDPDGFHFPEVRDYNKSFCFELFDALGIPVWKIEGLEADDLIAAAVQTYINCPKEQQPYEQIIIRSNDTDLNQLLSSDDSCDMVKMSKKSSYATKNDLYGYEQFKEEFPDLEPEDWVL